MKVDNYNLKNLIRKGRIGNIYLTIVNDDPKKYVTKVYEREEIEQKEMKRYLENEIISLKNLEHPNIIKLYDIKKSKKHFFLIFEYCNGGTLSEALEKYMEKFGNPFPEEIIQYLMRQIIDAFKYIHGKRIMHKNIKLENILLNYENEEDAKNFNLMKAKIKISHFDKSIRISKNYKEELYYELEKVNLRDIILDPSKKISRYIGYNENADIWLIGALCYQMLIGQKVFFTEDLEKFYEQIKKGRYSVPTNLSYEVISFINAMLLYEPKKRFTSSELYRHDFLNKDVNKFKKIILGKLSDKIILNKNEIKDLHNITIWSIFNKKDEAYLSSILGSEFTRAIDLKDELEFPKENLQDSPVKNQTIDIPNNLKNEKMAEISKNDLSEMKNDSENKNDSKCSNNNKIEN